MCVKSVTSEGILRVCKILFGVYNWNVGFIIVSDNISVLFQRHSDDSYDRNFI